MTSTTALLLLLSLSTTVNALTTTARPAVVKKSGIRPALSSDCHAYKSAAKAGIHLKIASPQKGLGAFATKCIPVGTFLGQYDGEKMTRDQVKARYWGKRSTNAADDAWKESREERGMGITGNYVFELKDDKFICAEDGDKSGWCRFMNHASGESKDCNVRAFERIAPDDEILEYPHFYAIRDINVGDELSFDYGPLFFCP